MPFDKNEYRKFLVDNLIKCCSVSNYLNTWIMGDTTSLDSDKLKKILKVVNAREYDLKKRLAKLDEEEDNVGEKN